MSNEPQTQIQKPPRVAFHTLGCKLNYAETSTLARQFVDRGYEVVDTEASPDVFVLNTCSVTENADKECRQLIRRALRKSPDMHIAVTGCYAQLQPESIASIPGVSSVLGSKEKFEFFKYLDPLESSTQTKVFAEEIVHSTKFFPSATAEGDSRSRTFLKIQDGCDYSCAFCTIPLARGASRSAQLHQVVEQGRELSRQGFHEIVLTGVNTGDFGRKTGESFLDLIAAMEADDEITARLRISSIEPNLLSEEIIRLIANSKKWCHHFHMPLQSGSPRILRRMQRRYNIDLYQSRLELIHSLIPDSAVGADVIVGFPGETSEDFEETFNFIQASEAISYLHVFSYSERAETRAATMPGVIDKAIRKQRNARLTLLSEKKRVAFYERSLHQFRDIPQLVLLDRANPNSSDRVGWTSNYVRVKVSGRIPENAELATARLGHLQGDCVSAMLLNVKAERRSSATLLPILG